MELIQDNLNLTRYIILRITHDLINPLGAMSMLIDEVSENKGMISESLDEAINILEIVRSIFNSSLTLAHAKKITDKYMKNITWNIQNDTNNSVASIMLILSLISIQKQQKTAINLLENSLNINLTLSDEELDALYLKEGSLSSYTSYIYLISTFSKISSYNISYEKNLLTIKFS